MSIFTIIARLVMFALTAGACLWLTAKAGPWAAAAIWAGSIGALCTLVALLMHTQSPGRITIVNRIAGVVLPWGYRMGQGRLAPIVIDSSLRWTLLGVAIILAAHRSGGSLLPGWFTQPAQPGYHPGAIMMTLLVLSWIACAAVLFQLITVNATRGGRGLMPATLVPMLAVAAVLIASVALTTFSRSPAMTGAALALTGGPVALVGGGFGLFMLVVLTFGRNMRWN